WWAEKDLAGGGVIWQEIQKGIDACHEAIVLVSPNSVNSQWVMLEVGAVSMGQHKRVTPILNHVSHDAMKPLTDIKAIDLNDFEKFLSQLKKRIQQAAKKATGR
ncbi:MAG: toll/interleukin-1 receptor domain-containing protein, partial [Armatimonadota bacterium]|nr:toll/interleukin-1 receptor domain-containing protein [Armatimonadota bacterium]